MGRFFNAFTIAGSTQRHSAFLGLNLCGTAMIGTLQQLTRMQAWQLSYMHAFPKNSMHTWLAMEISAVWYEILVHCLQFNLTDWYNFSSKKV